MAPKNKTKEEVAYEKKRILDEALRVVETEGYSEISMRKIGAGLGISHTKIYYYYKNKDEILLALVNIGYDGLKNDIVNQCESITDPKEKLSKMVRIIFDYGIEYYNYFKLMFGIEVQKPYEFVENYKESEVAVTTQEKAEEFYQYFSKVVVGCFPNYTSEEVLNVFVKFAGIVWLKNARLLNSIEADVEKMFDEALKDMFK